MLVVVKRWRVFWWWCIGGGYVDNVDEVAGMLLVVLR
jgi:hypothetical protein